MTPSTLLYTPERHAPLVDERWDERRARDLLAGLIADIVSAYRGPAELWPNHPDDLEGDPDVPMRTLYLGAGGIVWALARLERTGHAAPALDLVALARSLPGGLGGSPEFASLYPPPQPSLLMGSAGLLLLSEVLEADLAVRDELAVTIAANAQNPTRELLWGSPGTMLVALALHRRTGDARWAGLWLESATWLLEQWRDDLWEQDMYGRQVRFVGAGHGFASNALALLRGRDLLDAATAGAVEHRVADVLSRLAERDGELVQWPAVSGAVAPRPAHRTQWCHGAPGMISSLAGLLPASATLDGLFAGGGELAWQAGPLRASAGLCHGTAGNGYAFLRLFARTGDERWLARARAFALHAARQVAADREAEGHGRWSLFTGAAGVALFLAACLDVDPRFPLLDELEP